MSAVHFLCSMLAFHSTITCTFAAYPFSGSERVTDNPKENGRYESENILGVQWSRVNSNRISAGTTDTVSVNVDCTYAAAHARVEIKSALVCLFWDGSVWNDNVAPTVMKDDIYRYCNDAVGSCQLTLRPSDYGIMKTDCRVYVEYYCRSPAAAVAVGAAYTADEEQATEESAAVAVAVGAAYTAEEEQATEESAAVSVETVVLSVALSVVANLMVLGMIYVCCYQKCYQKCFCFKSNKGVKVGFEHEDDIDHEEEIEVEMDMDMAQTTAS
eukprot:CAMPEP_0197075560 /NCGR_PEP_ID=MMETSP1384-20130603/211674_1 /TAXON_ID=29189 /ORGANISM="Ammonia sp." /LENGTH=270 /DNA_ID=CAMNT_0042514409 /DNA_START=35 /DNA_END=848 /DNA_ORIENTATION=-